MNVWKKLARAIKTKIILTAPEPSGQNLLRLVLLSMCLARFSSFFFFGFWFSASYWPEQINSKEKKAIRKTWGKRVNDSVEGLSQLRNRFDRGSFWYENSELCVSVES